MKWREYRTINRLRENVISAKEAWKVAKANEALFQFLGPAKLNWLMEDPNDSLAIRAAWEKVRVSLPEEGTSPSVIVDSDLLQSFVVSVERRLRLSVPKWWKEEILAAQAYK